MRHEIFDVPGFVGRSPVRQTIARSVGWKRWADILGASILIVLLAPVIGALWLVVRRDGGPGFFGHRRVGRNGVEFTCWKLRTMVPDSQAVLAAHLRADRAAALEWHDTYKLRDDPRITRIGKALRSSSLDELPQLWNVLRGDMSLVGPRPVPKAELQEYAGSLTAYYALRPGMTGLWQVSGRNRTSYAERVALDTEYARRISFKLDLIILLRTVGVVLRRTGV